MVLPNRDLDPDWSATARVLSAERHQRELAEAIEGACEAMSVIREEGWVSAAVAECRRRGCDAYEGVDLVLRRYEEGRVLLPVPGWRLLREMVTAEFHLYVLMGAALRGPGGPA